MNFAEFQRLRQVFGGIGAGTSGPPGALLVGRARGAPGQAPANLPVQTAVSATVPAVAQVPATPPPAAPMAPDLPFVVAGGSITPGPNDRWNRAFNDEWERSHDPHLAGMYANEMTGNRQFTIPHEYQWPHSNDPRWNTQGGWFKYEYGTPGMTTPLIGRYTDNFDNHWNHRWNELFNQAWAVTHSDSGARLYADEMIGNDMGSTVTPGRGHLPGIAEHTAYIVNPFSPRIYDFSRWLQEHNSWDREYPRKI